MPIYGIYIIYCINIIYNTYLFIIKVHCATLLALGLTWSPSTIYTAKHYTAKVRKADIYTGKSNQDQMMRISRYIVRWSKQKAVYILIVSRWNT